MVVLSVRISSVEPIAGRASVDDESEVGFEGWLEFLGVVSRLLHASS